MASVRIYTKDPCPYCVRAIRLLTEKNIDFEEIDLTDQWEEMDRIKNETGWRTMPVILIHGKLVGGYDDLKALNESGELDRLISLKKPE